MKKTTTKKLTLKKETVRKLNEAELRRVAGGTFGWSNASACCPCTGTSTPPSSPQMCPVM